eukprot:363127-Chlamydomonas_euryale.AAC.11
MPVRQVVVGARIVAAPPSGLGACVNHEHRHVTAPNRRATSTVAALPFGGGARVRITSTACFGAAVRRRRSCADHEHGLFRRCPEEEALVCGPRARLVSALP